MHTIFRFCSATLSYLKIVAVFAAWGALACLAGSPMAAIAAVLFAAVFFAPAAYINAWDDFGD